MKPTIAVTLSSFAKHDPSPKEILEKARMRIVLNPHGRTVTEAEIVDLAGEAAGLIAGTENLSAQVLEQLPHVKVISRCGVGLDNVDLNAAHRRGIKVFSTPDGPTIAVAELVIGLAINLLRQITVMDRGIRAGPWQKKMGSLFSGKYVGIVGLGRIGRAVAHMCLALNAKVLYYDPAVIELPLGNQNSKTFVGGIDADESFRVKKEKLNNQKVFPQSERCELDELFKLSDIVSIHVPFSEKTKYLVNAQRLALMKKESVLINCSRGGVVDETALYDALREKRISGAALDVFEEEPYNGPLKDLDNVILTPHVGSYARESRVQMEVEAVKNLLEGLKD